MTAEHTDHPSLKDRVVLVTGGSRGLGYEMAMALVQAGARVAITSARGANELADVRQEVLDTQGPDRLIAVQADVCDYADCEAVVGRVLSRFGRLDCLINNAGRGLMEINPDFVNNPIPFYKAPVSGWNSILTTNVLGVFHMSRAAAPHMIERGFGRIINISTSDVTMVRSGYSPYGPSKAALEAMSRIWATELVETGVTVNVLLPGGATDTAMLPASMTSRQGSDGNLLAPKIMREPALWLCSDRSGGRTGERYIAKLWDTALPSDKAAEAARDIHHEKPGIM